MDDELRARLGPETDRSLAQLAWALTRLRAAVWGAEPTGKTA